MAIGQYDNIFKRFAADDRRLSTLDPELEKIWLKKGPPRPFIPVTDKIEWFGNVAAMAIRKFNGSNFVKQILGDLPNADFEKYDRTIPTRDLYEMPIRVCRTQLSKSEGRPVLVMTHGGGFVLGDLDTEDFACELICRSLDVVVVSLGYRLSPESVSFNLYLDVYDGLKWVSENATSPGGDLSKGFINAGVSGGGNLTCAATYLARDENMQPPLTGVMYMCTGMPHSSQDHLGNSLELWPGKLISWNTLRDNPISSHEINVRYRDIARLDVSSRHFTPFNRNDHSGLPALYYQVASYDVWRDSALFYTHMVQEAGCKTRLDVYQGMTHCFWASYPQLAQTKRWAKDTVNGVRWLLEQIPKDSHTRSRL